MMWKNYCTITLWTVMEVNIEITIRKVCFDCDYCTKYKAFSILKSRQKKLILILISKMSERNVYYISF